MKRFLFTVLACGLLLSPALAQAGEAEFRACVHAKVKQLEAKRDPHLMHWFTTLDKTRAGEKTLPRPAAVTSVYNRVAAACRRYR
jgi:hypothetical protein